MLIAEIGSVHDGSFGNAKKLIEAAKAAGADAVKFQTHIAEAESLASAPSPGYFSAEPRMDYFRRTGFSLAQWKELAKEAAGQKLVFLSSPFSLEAVDLLEEVGVPEYKIPSGEVTNLPLLEYVAKTKKPVLLSSGMSNWAELDQAMKALEGAKRICIMQCSSVYPCPPEKVGLNVIGQMKERYGVEVGFSDHTLGYAAPLAAAALGATVIEKHFTFSRLMYGSDAKHSMEPGEFAILAQSLKEIWTMQKHPVNKDDIAQLADMKRIFQKSIVTSQTLAAGTVLEAKHLAYKKPGDGISAAKFRDLIGKKIKKALPADYQLKEEDFS